MRELAPSAKIGAPTQALPYAIPDHGALREWLRVSHYHGYAYSYPHKTAYRPFAEPLELGALWQSEARDRLALYLHVPFCEFRCGFCNLFAAHGAQDDDVQRFLDALGRQAEVVRENLGPHRIALAAIGGGTPTFLSPRHLARLLEIYTGFAVSQSAPLSVETSPATATRERLELLAAAGVSRISIGVQSFLPGVRRSIGRPEPAGAALRALELLREFRFPRLNVDLIYGAPVQTEQDLDLDLEQTLLFRPEEIYLYPLYVRPQTGVALRKSSREPRVMADHRPALLRHAAARLTSEGYERRSLRCFVRTGLAEPHVSYRCELDAMVGLGPGARSYTTDVHYAAPWSVAQRDVRATVKGFCAQPERDFARAAHGFALDSGERHRRFVIQSLLDRAGLSLGEHHARFGVSPFALRPELRELFDLGLATLDEERLVLTDDGLDRADAIGPWLYSPRVRALMAESST